MSRYVQVVLLVVTVGVSGAASPASAQLATGTITGIVTDDTGAVAGVTVSLAGERLIGGTQTQVTNSVGAYRFERLPPGSYDAKFEILGFKPVERRSIKISATFTATVNVQLEVGSLEETITVTGESPTVDTTSNVQQTIMGQDLLEGVPTGRDPWSVGKLIPGVQVGTYDVGGTQGMQQSSMSAHGSNASERVYAIDGLNINWPIAGGNTLVYFDQGMFEEVNFQTSAIPAEVAVGGVYMNMVTKEGGNRWRGDIKSYYANDSTQADNSKTPVLERFGFPGGNPILRQYDFNVTGGGPLQKDRVWMFLAFRDWRVDKLTLGARNPDGTFALDDNRIRNYSGKLTWQATRNHKFAGTYNYNNKQRFHRRDAPPAFVEDKASYIQNQFGGTGSAKYTGVLGSKAVFESGFGYMGGTFPLSYQKDVAPTDIRVEDAVRNTAINAAPQDFRSPGNRVQFDNAVSYAARGFGGSHNVKAGVQYSRMHFEEQWRVNGDLHILFNDGVPNAVRVFNTPTAETSNVRQLGVFVQDSWTVGTRITLNVGARFDTADGWIPEQEIQAGRFVEARRLVRQDVIAQRRGVWRTGLVYDVSGDGRTAIKANYSRYASQVDISRTLNVHPFRISSGTRPWNDLNRDGMPQDDELGAFSGFPEISRRYADANGPEWPYSDEITAGIEHQLVGDLSVGAVYFHRTNRLQVGLRNVAVPASAYTASTVTLPDPPTGPGGTVTFYNLERSFLGLQDNVLDNDELLDTEYNGVELTATKRFSGRWQMLAGLTLGKNFGGVNSGTSDLNDPNFSQNFPTGVFGNDSFYSAKLAGSYRLWQNVTLSGSLLRNQGYPYQSVYRITRTTFPTLTRASQDIRLSERGEERLDTVTLLDLRVSRAFRFGNGRQIKPELDVFNVMNASSVVGVTPNVGSRYLAPTEILGPRLFRIGLSLNF